MCVTRAIVSTCENISEHAWLGTVVETAPDVSFGWAPLVCAESMGRGAGGAVVIDVVIGPFMVCYWS